VWDIKGLRGRVKGVLGDWGAGRKRRSLDLAETSCKLQERLINAFGGVEMVA
jgi:hypothetical protein